MNRKEVLDAAAQIVCNDREQAYGAPEDNFALIGKLWGLFLRTVMDGLPHDPTPDEVAVMMILVKVARIATGKPKADNYIDLAGYAACGGEIATRGAVEDEQD